MSQTGRFQSMLLTVDKQVLSNPDFRKLVRSRRWLSTSFLLLLLGLYLIFSLLSVYAPTVLAQPLLTDGVVPFGIFMGYAILALTFILSLIYIWVANHVFEPLEKKIMAAIVTGTEK